MCSTVKKIRLRKDDKKMLREVNAISGLSHRFIVRYVLLLVWLTIFSHFCVGIIPLG